MRRLFAAIMVGLALFGPIGNDACAQKNAAKSKAAPADKPQPPELGAIQNGIERIARAVEAQAGDHRSQEEKDEATRNTNAAERSAKWAKMSFYAAVGSVGVSLLALLALLASLRQTRAAITDNRLLGRGYISIDLRLASLMDNHSEARPAIHGSIANTGQSHLKDIKVRARGEIRRMISRERIGDEFSGLAEIATL